MASADGPITIFQYAIIQCLLLCQEFSRRHCAEMRMLSVSRLMGELVVVCESKGLIHSVDTFSLDLTPVSQQTHLALPVDTPSWQTVAAHGVTCQDTEIARQQTDLVLSSGSLVT